MANCHFNCNPMTVAINHFNWEIWNRNFVWKTKTTTFIHFIQVDVNLINGPHYENLIDENIRTLVNMRVNLISIALTQSIVLLFNIWKKNFVEKTTIFIRFIAIDVNLNNGTHFENLINQNVRTVVSIRINLISVALTQSIVLLFNIWNMNFVEKTTTFIHFIPIDINLNKSHLINKNFVGNVRTSIGTLIEIIWINTAPITPKGTSNRIFEVILKDVPK